MFAHAYAGFLEGTGTREEVVTVLVQRQGEYPIGIVEGFLDPITMVDINVNLQYSGMVPQQFQDSQNDIVDVAEPTGFGFLSVVEPSTPVDRNIRCTRVQLTGSSQARTSVRLAEGKHAIKDGTVIGKVEA